jgi:PAS domain S-box-containing protein
MNNVETDNDHEQATETGGFSFYFGSIRTRLLVIFVLLVLLPALTIGAASGVGSWQSGKRQIQNELEGVAALKEDQIEFWLQGLRTEISFELARESAPEQMRVLLQDTPGTADFQAAYDAQLARFQQSIDLKKDFEEFFLMDREGQVVLSTEADQLGKRYASQTFFKEGLKNLFVQPPLYAVAQDKVLVVLALPVRDAGEQVLGVLAGRVGMERLSEFMAQRTGLGETGETYLIGGNKALLTALRFPSDVTYIRTLGTSEAVENQAQGFDIYEDYQGVPVVGVYRWLPNLQVALMAEQDRAEAFRAVYDTLGIITGIALAAVLSAIVLGVFVTRGIANPLADLTTTSQRIAAGDLKARVVGITSRDEIGVLATTFNAMADRVSSLLKSLEERSTELAERTRELEASQRVTFAASERVSPDELLSIVVNLIRDQFDLYHVQVYTVDSLPGSGRDAGGTESMQAAVLRESTGYAGRQLLQRKHHIPLDREHSLVVQAIREGQPVLVDDVSREPDFMPNPLLPDTRSELVVPLKVGKRVLGALDAQHREPGRFSESTIALFQTMADQISFLFENSELIERVSEQTEVLTLFTNQLRTAADIARQLGTILDPERLLEQLVEMMQSRFGLYHVHIYVLDEKTNQLIIRAGSGEVGRVLQDRGHYIPLNTEKSLVARAARNRETVYVEDTSTQSDFMPNPLLPQTRSELALPLVAGDQVLGVLDVQDDQAGRFTEADLDTFITLAGQVATALENARLFTQTQDLLAEVDQIFNSAGDGMRVVDKDFNTLRVNETFAAMAGLSEGEATDAKCYEVLRGSLCNTPDCPLVRILGGQEYLEAEVDKERVDGTTFPCSVMATPFKTPDGEVIGIVEVFRDITERKGAEQERERFTTQLRTAADLAEQINGILDPDQLLREVANQLRERFNLYHVHAYLLEAESRTLVMRAGSGEVGQVMLAREHKIPLDRAQSLVARAARTKEIVHAIDTALEADFMPNPLLPETRSEVALPLMAGDRVLGILDVQDDQPGRFTQSDLDVFSTLAGQIATALQNAGLFEEVQQTAERLREVDRLKSEFLANMSHELRTPLNSILGYTEVMLMGINGDMDAETHEDVRAIYDNGQHLLRLINDILDLAKIEAGRMALNLENVDVAPLLEDIKTNSAGLLVNKPVEMILEVEDRLPSIKADRTRVNQVLTNLVSNAAKFTEQGQVTLRAFREGDEWICMEVEDTGIGIQDADLENIFEQFRQADGSFKRRAEGTGLGLAITRHLVTMHGGTISVHSQVGSGSTFTVRLPIESRVVEVISGSSNGKQR